MLHFDAAINPYGRSPRVEAAVVVSRLPQDGDLAEDRVEKPEPRPSPMATL